MREFGKLLIRARENAAGFSFKEFEKLMQLARWQFRRQKGSHRLWYSPGGYRLPVQATGRNAKSYQVRQFLAQYEREHGNG